mmetsp:Transcript_26766/g.44397  ORF Transcript_26766/g.44397 Transcript_26766/m.44397 type:complete len:101 (-) Transcript_26766:242-544(-)
MKSWVSNTPLDKEEAAHPSLSKETRAQISALFRLYDKNSDGYLTATELIAALNSCGITKHDIQQIVNEQDHNEDAKLDESEFTSLMESTGAFYDSESDSN